MRNCVLLRGRGTSAVLLGTLFLAAGCGDSPKPAELTGREAIRLDAVTPTSVTGTVGHGVTAPAVRVTNQAGKPVPGVRVSFSVTPGDGVTNAVTVTDSAGTASAGVWTLGKIAGLHTATASALEAASVTFTANAMPGPAAQIAMNRGDNQFGFAGAELVIPLRVVVTDAFGNAVSLTRVSFAVVSGGGTIADASALSDSLGIATAHWKLGAAGGKQTSRAQLDSALVTFSAFACDSTCEAEEMAYVRDGQVYVTQQLGGAGRQLTTDASQTESSPAWSPDGLRLAFSRDRTMPGQMVDASSETWIVNADGSDARRRITGYHSPSWSPDGSRLVVARGDCIYFCELFVISADAPEGSPITSIASFAGSPNWSPDGKKIVYVGLSGDDGYHHLETANPDGNDRLTIVPTDEGAIFEPAWSPDGRQIAFSKCIHAACNLYVVNADGSGLKQLTTIGGVFGATWSPDGSRIGFTISQPPGDRKAAEVAFVLAGGGEPFLVVYPGYSPAWRPKPKS